jgi:hypothetical protein
MRSKSACLKGGASLFFHLDADAAADDVGAVLDRVHLADVKAHRGVELEREAAGRHLGAAEHNADLLPQLVDEDH